MRIFDTPGMFDHSFVFGGGIGSPKSQEPEAGGHRGAFRAERAEAELVGLFALVPAIAEAGGPLQVEGPRGFQLLVLGLGSKRSPSVFLLLLFCVLFFCPLLFLLLFLILLGTPPKLV